MKITIPFGGESPRESGKSFAYLTDSGRSSLKLILRSELHNKKVLIPDFICDSVIRVLKETGTKYSFYHIDDSFNIDRKSMANQSFNILYIVDYFGMRCDPRPYISRDVTVIEDGVFTPFLDIPIDIPNWIGFNSFRKITDVADGSITISTKKLHSADVLREESPSSVLRYKAKCLKAEMTGKRKSLEHNYLELFARAESLLEEQKNIYCISSQSMAGLLGFYRNMDREHDIRRRYRRLLDRYLKHAAIVPETEYPAYYVLRVPERDALKKHLASKRIYLPVHWPRISAPRHRFYDELISIPLFSRYTGDDMTRIARLIAAFYKGRNAGLRVGGR